MFSCIFLQRIQIQIKKIENTLFEKTELPETVNEVKKNERFKKPQQTFQFLFCKPATDRVQRCYLATACQNQSKTVFC